MPRTPMPKAPPQAACGAEARPASLSSPVPWTDTRPGWLDRLSLGARDREVLWLYVVTRLGLWITAYCAAPVFASDPGARRAHSMLSIWERWDWAFFQHIAEYGYFGGAGAAGTAFPDNREAFFPGFPLVLRLLHTVVPSWALAGLLISFVAGAVAVLALARIASLSLPLKETGVHAALFLLVSPCAVFLAAGYSEALFLAFALPAWLTAKKGDWPLAASLAAFAVSVRISGLFLAAALLAQFLVAHRGRHRWRSAPWLVLPWLPAMGYTWYLHAGTGDWMAWRHAEEHGWYRQFHPPWETWRNTWAEAFANPRAPEYAVMSEAELVAVLVGVLLLALLLVRRQWPEAVYIGLSLWALGTSYRYMSVPRATLLWWPLWTTLAIWSMRRPWFTTVYLCLAVPLMTVLTLAFTSGRWAG
ncbi:mannosyltransferase family protein [Streptomyces sp. NPDC002537]